MTPSFKAALTASLAALFIFSCAPAVDAPVSPVGVAAGTSTSRPVWLPTAPVSPVPELTATLVPISAPTEAGPADVPELGCKLNWQSPVDGTKLEPRTDFTVRWNITNTGTSAWEPGDVDLIYSGGTRMFFSPVIPLADTVSPGQSATLIVDMKALRNTSSYITTWALRRGETYFCTLSVLIYVQWHEGKERSW